MSETCIPHHDPVANILTGLLCLGIAISYLPQHLRIINAKSSEGFSPWFLLLGSTSSFSGMLNIIVMQWSIVQCCHVLSYGECVESVAGIFQLGLQWFLFTSIQVLYIIYYPPHLKHKEVEVKLDDENSAPQVKPPVKSNHWRLSIALAWVVVSHVVLFTFVTWLLLAGGLSPDPQRQRQISMWATFLGIDSAALAAVQYAPQLLHTYRSKLVGALSIKMMLIQSPGAVLMVLSIALRPGTNWTTWLPYAVAGAMQGSLLVMCLIWHARQRELGIDDFGNPIAGPPEGVQVEESVTITVEGDVTEGHDAAPLGEETPLLSKDRTRTERKGWFGWLR